MSDFDELDRVYRFLWGEGLHHGLWVDGDESRDEALGKMRELVMGKLGLREGEGVLDVGCGYGILAGEMARGFGVRVDGVCDSGRQVEWARRPEVTATDGCRFFEADWQGWEGAGVDYDKVVCLESFSHSDRVEDFWGQVRRFLKPGGRVVVADWFCAVEVGFWEKGLLWVLEQAGGVRWKCGVEIEALQVVEKLDLTREVKRTWPEMWRRVFGVRKWREVWEMVKCVVRQPLLVVAIPVAWFLYEVGILRYEVVVMEG